MRLVAGLEIGTRKVCGSEGIGAVAVIGDGVGEVEVEAFAEYVHKVNACFVVVKEHTFATLNVEPNSCESILERIALGLAADIVAAGNIRCVAAGGLEVLDVDGVLGISVYAEILEHTEGDGVLTCSKIIGVICVFGNSIAVSVNNACDEEVAGYELVVAAYGEHESSRSGVSCDLCCVELNRIVALVELNVVVGKGLIASAGVA